jgi:hypothetical protein
VEYGQKKDLCTGRCKSLAKPFKAGKARPSGQYVDFTLGSYSPLLKLYLHKREAQCKQFSSLGTIPMTEFGKEANYIPAKIRKF